MIIEQDQNILDLIILSEGEMTNIVDFLLKYNYSDINQVVATEEIDLLLNNENDYVGDLSLNNKNIVTGDDKYNSEIFEAGGDFNNDFNNDYLKN